MKRTLYLSLMILVLISLTSLKVAYADSPGFLDGVVMTPTGYGISSGSNIKSLTDNNDSTSVTFMDTGGGAQYIFSSPIDVNRIYYKGGTQFYFSIQLLNSSGTVLYSKTPDVLTNSGTKSGWIDIPLVANVSKVIMRTTQGNTFTVNEFNLSGPLLTPHDEVTNLNATPNGTNIDLSYSVPTTNTSFTGIEIYRNGTLIKTLGKTETTYSDTGLQYSTTYQYKVKAVYSDGVKTPGATVMVTTSDPPKPPNDISELTGSLQWNNVSLSWLLPNETTNLDKISVYRDGIKIGETQGNVTTFNDPNVKALTQYQYTIKTVSAIGLESNGVSLTVNTPKEPTPVFKGTFTQKPDGNYTITWSEPTSGSIKVIIRGQTVATVPATDGSYTIPQANMKYTALGDPDVIVQPISKSGLIGDKVTWPKQSINTPFSATDLIQSGNSLLWLLGPFVLLSLSFLLVPKLRRLIFFGFKKDRKELEKEITGSRRTKEDSKESKELKEKIESVPREPNIRMERETRAARMKSEVAANVQRESRRLRVSRTSQFNVSRTQRRERSEREPRRARELKQSRTPRERRDS
jgi:hypothetical protein